MKIIDEALNGLKLVELDKHHDERGFFSERYNEEKFKNIKLPTNFVQDNFSRSKANVIRGLHYQQNPDQAKLVGCTKGKILDVAVDIRKNSKTFGDYYSVELSDDNGKMLYVPAGFAHGFAAITDADVMYKVDGLFNAKGDGGIRFNDEELNIDWGINSLINNVIVSSKDKNLQSFEEYKNNPIF